MEWKEIAQRIAAIRNDRDNGSRQLADAALLLLSQVAGDMIAVHEQDMSLLYKVGVELIQARPAMAAIANAVYHALASAEEPTTVSQNIDRLRIQLRGATQSITRYARPYLHGQLLTCSLSGSVLDTLSMLGSQVERVIALEGRPRYEGRETARILSQRGLRVTLITDAQASIFLPRCQAVVVGADSILADGDLLNKAGTALLAWGAQGYHVPFYVLSESLKISPQQWSTNPEQYATNLELLEEKEPEEVLAQAIPGVSVRNFYFDHTPYHLISKVITELGILEQSYIADIAARVQASKQSMASKLA